MQPGPFLAYLLGRVARLGWRGALPAALAPLISDGPIIVLLLALLAQAPPWLLRILGGAGGAFLLWLAWSAGRAWLHYQPVQAAPAAGRQSLLEAALTNALGPGPWIFWGLVGGPLILQAWGQSPGYALAFLAGFYGVIVLTLAGVIVLFGRAAGLGPRFMRGLLGLAALALAGFGVWQIVQAMRP